MLTNWRGLRPAFLVAATLLQCASPVLAQGGRVNPFLPHETAEEQMIIAEKEKMREAIREILPEINAMLAPALEEQKAGILAQAVEQVMVQIKEDPAFAQAIAGAAGNNNAATTSNDPLAVSQDTGGIPVDAKFFGCINGKALYRDPTGARYYDESASATARCAQ